MTNDDNGFLPPFIAPPPCGVGTELTAIFKELGVAPKKSCGCAAKAAVMNAWGIVGCREQREEILAWMKEAYDAISLTEWIATGAAALRQGKPKSLAGILDLAMERAISKGHVATPLKVAFLTPGLNMGGAERWVASLCSHFDTGKIHAAAVVVQDPKYISPEAKSWFPAYTKIISDVELLPQVLKQVDILISWGPVNLDSLAKVATIPFVDVAHGTLGHWDGQRHNGFKVQESIARQAIAAGAHLAAVNEECLLNYPEEVRSRVSIIPNGAEVSRVQSSLTREEARAKYGIQAGQKVVLFVGRFCKEKNLQLLVDAMEYLPGWTLLAAGPQYAMPIRLEGKSVIMPGTVDPPGDLYRAADVLCMPSAHEAHSLTLIESNLAGVPVVSCDYPAMRHLTEKHGRLASLAPVDCHPWQLANLISNAELETEITCFAQDVSERHYTAAAMALRWENYLLDLAGCWGGGTAVGGTTK